MIAIINSDVATGLRIKGAEGFIGSRIPARLGRSRQGAHGPPRPPRPPRPPPLSLAIAAEQVLESESRFWTRQVRASREPGASLPQSFLTSALQASVIAFCAAARCAVRAASA